MIEELLSGVYRLELGLVNAYLVRLQDGRHVLVDAGLPRHAASIADALASLGISPADLLALAITHRHLDHCGGAHGLGQRGLREIIVHQDDAAAVQGDEPLSPMRGGWRLLQPLVAFSDRRLFRYRPVPVRAVTEGYRLGELELLALPGHTAGHCGYWSPQRRVVFAGDASRAASSPFSFDPAAVRRTLGKLAELDAELYCFGHGPPLRGAEPLRRLAG